jgi:hypothetical protein
MMLGVFPMGLEQGLPGKGVSRINASIQKHPLRKYRLMEEDDILKFRFYS